MRFDSLPASSQLFDAMCSQSPDNVRQGLITEIEQAFNGVERGDGTTLHQGLAMDDYKTLEEQWAARRLDTETRWQDVPRNALIECQTALSFLDSKAFRYYLPAFMVRGLEDWDNDDGVAVDSCEYRLLQDSPNSLRKSEPASIAEKYEFTEAQCRAIAHFLRFVIGPDDQLTTQHATTLQAVEKWEGFVGEHFPAA